jgi:energy-coupling factor transporter ATP-binding protein EcfA2
MDQAVIDDLKKSGLTVSDMNVRALGGPERAATKAGGNVSGYVIPYYNIFGKPLTHYRIKLFDDPDIKYRQPKDSSTFVYFPKSFMAATTIKHQHNVGHNVVFITEGEKKATLACKVGLPTAALGGVDSWRNRVIHMPDDPALTKKGKTTIAKVESGVEVSESTTSMAIGLQDLIDYALQVQAVVIIVFDSDFVTGVQPNVQRAAAALAFELRNRGIAFRNIRQIILPIGDASHADADGKLGFDDFLLMDNGYETFQFLVRQCLEREHGFFPRHPSIVDYIGRRLQKAKLSRKESQQVAMAILSDLDATGQRLKSSDAKQMYYFDSVTKSLMEAAFLQGLNDTGHESPFGGMLYRRYGLSVADQKSLMWLSAQFNGEEPIREVSPERLIARARPAEQPDVVRYQISDGQYITVTANDVEIADNGHNKVLFECGHVKPLDKALLIKEFRLRLKEPVNCWWAECLRDTRIVDPDKSLKIHALLYYLSPWLNRWRGMQLPIEMALGESGSGKSTLFSLRLAILTGDSRLRNTPSDLKDWYASISNAGGLHVTDNVQMTDQQLRQKLSDELCRIVTEPNPFIEQRQYYTNVGIVRFPVKTTFAITAIRQPFTNADLMQRSFIMELARPASGGSTMYDMDWAEAKLALFGGREAWVAHHLHVLQMFFQKVKEGWDNHYRAKHRLIHLEQSLITMAKVFGWDWEWIPDYMVGIVEQTVIKGDWAWEGVHAFTTERRDWMERNPNMSPYVFAGDIADWAEGQEDYKDCEILKSARKLGRWMQEHKSMLAQTSGMVPAGVYGNKIRYRILSADEKGRYIAHSVG